MIVNNTINLKAGEPIHFSAVVAFKETGYWQVGACVTELVIPNGGPAEIYFGSPQDTIFLKIGVDRSTFESLPQPPPATHP